MHYIIENNINQLNEICKSFDVKRLYIFGSLSTDKFDENTSDISCSRPDFKTFGASVNQITIKAFEKIETIGGYAQNKLNELEKRSAQGEDSEALIQEVNQNLGDSVEKVIFINKLLDKK